MARASQLRIFALLSSQACQVVQQWLALKFTTASPPPACAELYLRIAPAACAFTLRPSRTYPRAESSTLKLLTSGHQRTAFMISTFTLHTDETFFALNIPTSMRLHTALITRTFTPRFTTYHRIDITRPPLHFVSLQLILAWRRKQNVKT